MKAFVDDLVKMVGGNDGGTLAKRAPKHVLHHGHGVIAGLKGKTSGKKALTRTAAQKLSPEQLIPLGDDDFGDF
jgi:hypothetical protein